MTKLFLSFTALAATLTAFSAAHAGSNAPQMFPEVQLAQAEMKMDDAQAMPTATPVRIGDIEVTPGFIKATVPGQPVAGGFVTMVNHGAVDDRLVDIKGVADVSRVEMHMMSMDGEIMRMRKLPDGIALPAGQTVALAPGGLHMMLMGLHRPFVAGQMVKMTLVFEKAGAVEITLGVVDMKGMGSGHQQN